MFLADAPVTRREFRHRRQELGVATDAFAALRWLALIGPRKVGKTSLLLEAHRRSSGVRFALLDVMERAPVSVELFRTLALRCADALLAERARGSLGRSARRPDAYRRLVRAAGVSSELQDELVELAREPAEPDAVARWLALPEWIARETDQRLVVAIDEVQELGALVSRTFDPFPMMRAAWQRHERVAYVISGSAPSALRELVTARHSPFFQHFQILDLGPFARADAVALLTEEAPADRPIPAEVAERVFEICGGHPFYTQLFGEALVATEPPYDPSSLKPVLQSLVFSRLGRLGLFFENDYARLVGRAATAAATLQAVAEGGPARLTDIAAAIDAPTASAAKYIERLGDALVRDDDGRYRVADPLFAWWVRWRSPGGTVVPMTVIGDEAEIAVARVLSALGFDLVYQSRGSRGAFDLLAIRGADQVGVQVKRSALPLRFAKAEWHRMAADAERFGWVWAIAVVDAAGAVRLLDPARATGRREVKLTADAEIDNFLAHVDARRGG